MDKREHYFQMAQELRRAMDAYHYEAMANNTSVHPNWYVLMNQLEKVIRNYRAYCRRHGLEYHHNDI